MMHSRLSAAFVLGALLLLTGCSEPTSVGANLGPDSLRGGTPLTQDVEPATLNTETIPARTGSELTGAAARSWRFLAGVVNDPIGGTLEATGYLDFLGGQQPAESIRTALAESLDAEIRLRPTYRHGDTSTTARVELRELAVEADMVRAPSDTSYPGEPQSLGTYTISPTDTLVTFPLPTSWIDEHLSALKDSAAFGDKINGFKFVSADQASTSDRKIVMGFELSTATLRLSSATDTTDFNASKAFTEIKRRSPPSIPPDRLLLQDGLGTQVTMTWDFDAPPLDTLKTAALNSAAVTVPVDTAALERSLQNVPDFVRPLPNGYRIQAILSPDSPSCIELNLFALPELTDTCALSTVLSWAPQAARMDENTAFQIFNQSFADTPLFRSYRVEIAVRQNPGGDTQGTLQRGLPSTLTALVPTLNSTMDDEPRATLTVTPL